MRRRRLCSPISRESLICRRSSLRCPLPWPCVRSTTKGAEEGQGNDGPRTGHLLSLLANLLSIPPPLLSDAQDAIVKALCTSDTLDALGRILNSKRHAQASSALRLLGEMVRIESSRARKIWSGLGVNAAVRRSL